jgi:imidazolonepropionase-like amidohydrolase
VDITTDSVLRVGVSAIEENEFAEDEARAAMVPREITRRRFVVGTIAGGVSLRGSLPSLPALAQQAAPDATIAITDVTPIDATGAPPRPQTTVVIAGDRIAEIRPSSTAANPDGASVVDGGGRYLIPGLWDAHVHTFVSPWQPDHQLPLFIANGVTGIRDMGGAFPASASGEMGGGFPVSAVDAIRSAIASGARIGPRIVAGVMVDGPTPVWPVALAVGTAEEGRQVVATIAEADADFVKVYTLLPREAYLAIAEAANERDFPFAGHVPIAVTAGEASDAGQRTIEPFSDSLLPYCSTAEEEILVELRAAAAGPNPVQGYAAAFFGMLPRFLETFDPGKVEALATRFRANQTWFTPTLILGRNAALAGDPAQISDPRLRYMPSQVVASWNPQGDVRPGARTAEDLALTRQLRDTGATITETMQRMGVPLMAGTDVGLPYLFPGFSLHDELALLVEAGLTPLEALQAATRNTAQAMALGDELGTVEVAKLADLVLLDADPLMSITNTTRIAAVAANGRLLQRAELDGLLQAAAEAAAMPAARPTA